MSNGRYYVTTAIPYVNGDPHLGHALEVVQADVLARHRRLRGQQVRFLTGTDDNALKNVTAAREAGVEVGAFVKANSEKFAALRSPLNLSNDDFLRTSVDPRHARAVLRLWERCDRRGDFYRHSYEGLYCTGCEQFYSPGELEDGRCAEHQREPESVVEENWFFRLSRYAGELLDVIESGRVRVEPVQRRHEVLAFIRSGLNDFSVSRPAERSGGWGIPVPGDPAQTIYVWWDALANYVSALDYASATDAGEHGPAYRDWWLESARRVHVIGKGVVRFHAVYWLALLLSAGEPLPSDIFIHDYLSANGGKLSKSAGSTVDPVELVDRYGSDALRWWLAHGVARVGDTDFSEHRLVASHDLDLANGLGNLVNRTVTLVHKFRAGRLGTTQAHSLLPASADELPRTIDQCLDTFNIRAATDALCVVIADGNRLVETERPWHLAALEYAGDDHAAQRLDTVLATLVQVCRVLATEAAPFIPAGAQQLRTQLGTGAQVGRPGPVFPRLARVASGARH
ncbi:methionine--tRNA ligase [Phytoactinopolyspora mesophila]|uniref:Methionine--tRNA ligase n=1 Tax=Phytoactinopolyspora mesophila TaxID=2650750 RepID=A0A7K3LYQ2_9ACTN|nr:methionine--tRNA ligase [Phytoactinopolyspora mesophila]NDL55947.1 methionine--tRNA ligase [Phytoactinopolyspora mesophila]